jgi:hypothetical protein
MGECNLRGAQLKEKFRCEDWQIREIVLGEMAGSYTIGQAEECRLFQGG